MVQWLYNYVIPVIQLFLRTGLYTSLVGSKVRFGEIESFI